MKNNKFLLSALIATSLMAPYAHAVKIPQPKAFSNKMSDAWDGVRLSSEITGVAESEMLPMDPEREAKYNFDRAARWEINQAEFFAKSYAYVIKNGIDPRATRGQKILGYASLATGYNYLVEPSFHDGLYTRGDRYFVRPELSAEGTFKKLDDASLTGKNSFNYNIEYSFYRHFTDPKLAVLSAPYFYKNLPFNANRAIDGLKVGDLFRFKARLNILVDTTYFTDVATSKLGASAGLYFLVTGGFEVHVMRMADNYVRLKIVGLRKQKAGGKLEVGYGSDLDIVGVRYVDNKLLEIVDTTIIQAQLERSLNRSFLADYIMDLNKPEVAKAYDQALAQARDFNYLKIVDPRNNPSEVSKEVLSNVTAIEEAMKAAQAGGDNKSIVRLFHGNNKVDTTSDWMIKLGNKILNVGAGGYNARTKTSSLNDEGSVESFVLENHHRQTNFHFFYSLFNIQRRKNVGVVSSSDEDFRNTDAKSFVMSYQRNDKRLRSAEVNNIRRQLERALPQYAQEIDLSDLDGKTHSNSSFRTQIVISSEALNSIPQMSKQAVEQSYRNHLSKIDSTGLVIVDINSVSARLSRMTQTNNINEKTQILADLRSSGLFQRTGAGFLISLIPADKVDSTVRVDVSVSANGADVVKYSKGPKEQAALYAQLLQNETVTKDDHYELRLEAESLRAKEN